MSNIILTIDTVSSPASLGLVKKSEIISQSFLELKKGEKEELSHHLKELINSHLESINEISGVAVINGPGSFSATRAGLALAKGITFAIKKPMVAVTTFDVMVSAYLQEKELYYENIIPLVDARKGRYFKAVYNKTGEMTEEPELIDSSYFNTNFETSREGIVLLMENINECKLNSYPLLHQTIQLSPIHISHAATSKGNFIYNEQDIAYLEPFYIVNNYLK